MILNAGIEIDSVLTNTFLTIAIGPHFREGNELRSSRELCPGKWMADWYNNRRLLGRLGHIPPVEAEKAYYASIGNEMNASHHKIRSTKVDGGKIQEGVEPRRFPAS